MTHDGKAKREMEFEFCASCGGSLDTGWECNDCGRDWRPWAYPWHLRMWHRLKKLIGLKP